jgi:uncharacterized membrane protein
MLVAVGDFVPRGGAVLRHSGDRPLDESAIRRMVVLDNERSHVGDAAYGFRKLVDITERSIASSPQHDPATAVQAIDRLHDAMRQLCLRELRGYVAIAFDEVVLVARSSPPVVRRLLAAFDDLIEVAPPDRRSPLEERRARLLARAEEEGIPMLPDLQGIGSGRDLLETD